ncbi:hypothetical protein BRCON_2199 [Candidatus Sumerlaea chitinivorans]|uniref:Uncharacterized protein n=1 Tax=Sumerlaea chitinivorans TaxID=2250252 RepID=A0A2Z4Y7H2_SUMC1|nr:hypothetical protein BRCON_2199 [Candidatus Sumerlaea chitinivorans]
MVWGAVVDSLFPADFTRSLTSAMDFVARVRCCWVRRCAVGAAFSPAETVEEPERPKLYKD